MNTDFACYFNEYFEAVPLVYSLNTDQHVLSLRPTNGDILRFKNIRMIKYGNSANEPNICENGFGYVVKTKDIQNKTIKLELEPFLKDNLIENLNVEVNLLNDQGLINLKISRKEDQSYTPEDIYIPQKNTATKKLT